jgi:hypothetical protein
MLDTNIFNYEEERREALHCHNIALWYKLFKEQQELEKKEQANETLSIYTSI